MAEFKTGLIVSRCPSPVAGLNEKQITILHWLSYGKRYDDIALIMDMKLNAVYQQAHLMMAHLGVRNAASAVGLGLRRGIIK